MYPDADHGFFCHEGSGYNRVAAEDAPGIFRRFFHAHLQEPFYTRMGIKL
ncbi:dienelactone hydrolase family protein [Scytonema sp. PCC 10023]